jgi:hypothetical protein
LHLSFSFQKKYKRNLIFISHIWIKKENKRLWNIFPNLYLYFFLFELGFLYNILRIGNIYLIRIPITIYITLGCPICVI